MKSFSQYITESKQIWEMTPNSKEYAELSYEELVKQAFGFDPSKTMTISPDDLHIKYKTDLRNAKYDQERTGLTPKQWARYVDLSKPIQVSFKNGKFYIEDGHHRYWAAKIRGKNLIVDDIDVQDKPHETIIKKAVADGLPVPKEVLAHYPKIKVK